MKRGATAARLKALRKKFRLGEFSPKAKRKRSRVRATRTTRKARVKRPFRSATIKKWW